jgi:hypothetical protein
MSRSQDDTNVSPAKKRFEYSSDDKQFKYYDKTEKKNILVPLPFKFIVLDRLATIKGYSDSDKSGIWSNDIKDSMTQPFTVKTSKGVMCEGLYQAIKGIIATEGGKWGTQLYIAYYEGKELAIGTLTLVGASNSAFIDFQKDNNIFKGAISVDSYKDAKKGNTKYTFPVFTKIEVTKETDKKAIELDKEVQVFLTQYFLKYGQANAPKPTTTAEELPTYAEKGKNESVIKDNDINGNADDLPF